MNSGKRSLHVVTNENQTHGGIKAGPSSQTPQFVLFKSISCIVVLQRPAVHQPVGGKVEPVQTQVYRDLCLLHDGIAGPEGLRANMSNDVHFSICGFVNEIKQARAK